jgi:hypothetical protein
LIRRKVREKGHDKYLARHFILNPALSLSEMFLFDESERFASVGASLPKRIKDEILTHLQPDVLQLFPFTFLLHSQLLLRDETNNA